MINTDIGFQHLARAVSESDMGFKIFRTITRVDDDTMRVPLLSPDGRIFFIFLKLTWRDEYDVAISPDSEMPEEGWSTGLVWENLEYGVEEAWRPFIAETLT